MTEPLTTELKTCIECGHDESTWNPVNGFCEFDPDPDDQETDYCECKCVFGFESEGERILYECSLREVAAPEWGTPLRMITEFDEDKLITLINSALAQKQTTTDPVEEALKELREMVPRDYWIRIDQSAFDEPAMNEGITYRVTISIDKLARDFEGATLSEAMAQVRAWKEQNDSPT